MDMTLISVDKTQGIFHLSNQWMSYIFSVEDGILVHKYYGKKVSNYSGGMDYPTHTRGSFAPNLPGELDNRVSLASLLQEYPGTNQGDYRSGSIEVTSHISGHNNTRFLYKDYVIHSGVVAVEGMPSSTDIEGNKSETLEIRLEDKEDQLELRLYFTVFAESPILLRKASIYNGSKEAVTLNKMSSLSLDFAASEKELIHLSGTWGAERQIVREPINRGIKFLDSRRGTSSHNQNPFFALVDKETTETMGDVYGFALMYSGNHEMVIERDSYDQLRVQMGINHETFSWELAPEESFMTPEVVMSYTDKGLTDYSIHMHEFVNHHIVQSRYKGIERPVLMNNWEATYMDFTEDKIKALMKEGADLGVELFVLDDGWFGKRNDDTTSLGDWWVNEEKLPNGLKGLADEAKSLGMTFGLWFEPEMVSPESDLFRAHPDWVLHYPTKGISPARNQYILDITRQEVRDYLVDTLSDVLNSADIRYVKWDMNRNFSEAYSAVLSASRQGEVSHRYTLGLYELLERITKAFPDILFESCSGGGGRFDLGMLYYMPQTWTSDNSDAMERLKIQYGTSLVYPVSSMGAHVSASPNHQNGRRTHIDTRGDVAMSGLLGYELDVLTLSDGEKEAMKAQITFYKQHRRLIQYGTFHRIYSPFEGNRTSWMFVSPDKSEAIVFYAEVLAEASPSLKVLQLTGLDPNKRYRSDEGRVAYGDEWMNMGYYVLNKTHQQPFGDFETSFVYMTTIEE